MNMFTNVDDSLACERLKYNSILSILYSRAFIFDLKMGPILSI